jgi:hypothetical protein
MELTLAVITPQDLVAIAGIDCIVTTTFYFNFT